MASTHRGSRRALIALGALGVVLVVAVAITFARDRDKGPSPVASVYVEAVAGTWQRINPLFAGPADNEVDQDLGQLVFAGLTRIMPDGTVAPDLAQRWDISEDGKQYTFHLRRDLRWHDGEPLTSADVAFTLRQLLDPGFRGDPLLADAWLGVIVATPDADTIEFTLKQPYAPFLARNTTLGILPFHLLGELSAEALFESSFNLEPVGAGPYVLSELSSREATLSANPRYHLERPAIATIKLRFFSDYPGALRALQSGELNGLMVREVASARQLSELRQMRGMRMEEVQRGAYAVLLLNNERVPFDDERVREAISRGVDRKLLAEKVYSGAATPSASVVAPGTWAYAQQYDSAGPDTTRARALLAEAGWQSAPGTGILVKEGSEFRFTIRTDNDPTRIALANLIAGQLEAIGLRVTVASTSFSVLRRDFLQQRQYDAALVLWDQGPDPDPYAAWHSSQTGPDGLNIANFGDLVIDSLIAQGRTDADIEVRREAYRQLQELWPRLSPGVILAYPRYAYVHSRDLESGRIGVLFSAAHRFADIARWKI